MTNYIWEHHATTNQSIGPTGGSRLRRCAFLSQSRLPPVPHAHRSAVRGRMQKLASLTAVALLLVCGCTGEKEMRFNKGTGDMGQFVMQQALKRGARPVTTNSLPVIGGDWSYSEDQYGVVLHLSRERFPEVEAFLQQAFGAPAQPATDTTDGGKLGWYSPKTIGVALQFGYDSNQTQVIVLRPQPASEIIKPIPGAIKRSGK